MMGTMDNLDLTTYFQYPSVQYAVIAIIMIALCSSLLGVTLVLKRLSFIGDGLSHVAFGAIAIAVAVNAIARNSFNSSEDIFPHNFFLVLPITIIAAVLLLRVGHNTKIKGDAALAMISVGSLAMGYLVMNLFSKSSNLSGDVCSTLFGSITILALTQTEMWLCVIFSLLITAVFLLFYNKIFAVTFDEDFASATGIKAKLYNLILAVIIAVVIVLAMNLVGALLISALVVFPALSAMRIFKSFRAVTLWSVIVSVICATLGILISIMASTPVGATIVAVDIVIFALFSAASLFMGRL